jgi:hypothetical protein
MNNFCAFAFPVTSFPKFSSLNDNVTEAFFGGAPLPTSPLSFKSMYQDSVAPDAFLSSKANMALPFLMASLRPASSLLSDEAMASKATEEGKASEAWCQHRSKIGPKKIARRSEPVCKIPMSEESATVFSRSVADSQRT